MKTNVNIKQVRFGWTLTITVKGQLIKSWTFKKLIEALDTACVLQVHVDNADELPLNQYFKAG